MATDSVGGLAGLIVNLEGLLETAANQGTPIGLAQDAQSTCASTKTPTTTFGGFPNSVAFGDHHNHIQGVYDQAIGSVQSELADFQQKLRECAKAHEENDHQQAERWKKMASRVGSVFSSNSKGTPAQHKSGDTSNHAHM